MYWLCLYRKFSLNDLLTNVMIYWTTGSIVSSMRFYKENLKGNPNKRVDSRYVAHSSSAQTLKTMTLQIWQVHILVSFHVMTLALVGL